MKYISVRLGIKQAETILSILDGVVCGSHNIIVSRDCRGLRDQIRNKLRRSEK